MRNAGQVVTRTMLLEHVWDYHFDPQTNVIDVHVSRLRAKIDKGFDKPLIHTIRGAGYMVRVGAEAAASVAETRRVTGASASSSAPPPSSSPFAYLVVFTVFAFLTLGYVAWNARRAARRPVRLDDRGRDQRPCPSSTGTAACAASSTSSSAARARPAPRSISSPPPRASASPAMSARLPPGVLDRPGSVRDRNTTAAPTRPDGPPSRAHRARLHAAGRLSPARRPRRRGARRACARSIRRAFG